MSLKICANLTFMFPETLSLLERYQVAKQYGFTAVECGTIYKYSVKEVQQAKESSQVEQILIDHAHVDVSTGDLGSAAMPEKVAEFRKDLDVAITYAKALNCKRIHVLAGIVQSPNSRNDETYKSNLQYAVKLFEKENIIGLIEPINANSVPGYYLNSFDKAISIIKQINSPFLKLMLDVFHLQMIAGNLTENITNFLPYTGHIQVAQAPHWHEPDVSGEMNYRYLFKLLKELNYCEWIGAEYMPLGDTKSGLKWMEMLDDMK